MQNIDEMMEYLEEGESFNLKQFLYRMLGKWYWFALFGILGVAVGYLVNHYKEPSYTAGSTILIREDSRGISMENFFEGYNLGVKTNVQNQIGILKSYSLNLRTLENLDWRSSIYKKKLFTERELYKNAPFTVTEGADYSNIPELTLLIIPISEDKYRVISDGNTTINGAPVNVVFDKEGRYGEPFKNEYFNFTLDMVEGRVAKKDEKYLLRFNDLNNQALAYQRKLNVSLTNKQSNLIRLELRGNIPAKEVDYLNELGRVFILFGLNEKNQTSVNTVKFIDSQLKGIVDSLQMAKLNFTDFRSRNRVIDLGQEGGLIMEQLAQLESDKAFAEMRLEYYKNLHSYLDDADQMKQVISPSVVGITDPGLNASVLKLSELYSKREVLKNGMEGDAPPLRLLENEITTTVSRMNENLENLLSNTENELRSIEQRIEKINRQLANLPKVEQEMIDIKRQFDLNNELYTFLLKKRAEAAITTASTVPDAKIVDPARIRTVVKIAPKTMVNYMAGLLLGLSVPLLFILIADYFNDTIRSKEEAQRETKLPILGMVAHRPYAGELVVVDHPGSGVSESSRGLRTKLRFVLRNKDKKVIAIQSTIPSEGKSVTSGNLAAIMAMNNKKVLLVGCDLRKPRLFKIFETDTSTGLSSYLRCVSSFNEVVKETMIENLSLVTCGPLPPNPAELLENGQFEQFIDEAKKKFDYVILDNAPVSLVSDGILTASFADSNLFMLREGYSHKEEIKYINELSESKTIENIAIIYNDTRKAGFGYGGRYGGYNYGYGKNYFTDKPPHRKKNIWHKFSINS